MSVSIADQPSPVKAPAELDTVLAHLRQRFDAPHLHLDRPPRPLSGGFWAEMWTLDLAPDGRSDLPARVVLRLAPDPQPAAWETTFQAGVAEQNYPTPKIYAFDFNPDAAARAWCVMEHVDGVPLLGGLSGLRALGALPRLATGLPDTLARAAADLHRLDPTPIENALAALGDRTVGVDSIIDHYVSFAGDLGDSALQRSIEQLASTRPSSRLRVVCHGDLHPFNVLSVADHHVVLDWTAGQIAHPAFDLAFTHLLLANPPLAAPKPLRPIINTAARRLANRFINTYRKIGPHPIDNDTLDWYRRLHACRIITDLTAWRADGTIDNHHGHPWLTMESVVRPLLAA